MDPYRWLNQILLLSLFCISFSSACVCLPCTQPSRTTNGPLILGISLGRTHFVAAADVPGRVEIITNSANQRSTPSRVAIQNEAHSALVGEELVQHNVADSLSFDNFTEFGCVSTNDAISSFHCLHPLSSAPLQPSAEAGSPSITPTAFIAHLLSRAKDLAQRQLDQPFTSAVVAVPNYFSESARQIILDAGRSAGLDIRRIVNEHLSSSLAYGLLNGPNQQQNILTFHLGGNELRVSVVSIDDGVSEVLSHSTDSSLATSQFQRRLALHLSTLLEKKHGIDLKGGSAQMQDRLYRSANTILRLLSTQQSAKLFLDEFLSDSDLTETISRNRFQELSQPLLRNIESLTLTTVRRSSLSPSDIQSVVLLGGGARMPAVQALISRMFPSASLLKAINPEEVSAYGAAVQGSFLNGQSEPCCLCDWINLSFGIETSAGFVAPLLIRNTPIPTKKTALFTTSFDNQTSAALRVYQGDRITPKYNRLIGELLLTDIPPTRRGLSRIAVTVEVDVNAQLTIEAYESLSAKKSTLLSSSLRSALLTLTPEALDAILQDVYAHEPETRAFRLELLRRSVEKYAQTVIPHGQGLTDSTSLRAAETGLFRLLQLPCASDSDFEALLFQLKEQLIEIGGSVGVSEYEQDPIPLPSH